MEQACHGDSSLRLQVDALLYQNSQGGTLFSHATEEMGDKAGAASPIDIHFSPGAIIGPYRIIDAARISAS